MSLQSLSSYCGVSNQSGLLTVEYVPRNWIDRNSFERILSTTYNWQRDVDLITGDWLTAQIFPTRRLWTETQGRTDQGKNYRQLVRGISPNLQPEVAGEFDRMAEYLFLLRIHDIKGRPWLLGTYDEPFSFFADGTSGENNGLKHHRIRFEAQTTHKAYGFKPVL